MKRILGCIILILCLCIFAQARAKYSGYAQKGGKDVKTSTTVIYQLMETFPACTVTVYIAGTTTLATIYQDNVGTAKANPFTSDSAAYFEFYADNGRYDIKFSGTGITTPFTRGNIYVIDPNDGIFNIKSFGAKCIGASNDDLAAIQATMDSAALLRGKVYIPASLNGCYVTNAIHVPDNISIDGDGYGSLIFVPDAGWKLDSTTKYGILNLYRVSNVRISNLRLRGTRLAPIDVTCDSAYPRSCRTPKLIYFEGVAGFPANNIEINHVKFENSLWESIWQGGDIVSLTNIKITNNDFSNIDGPSAITGNFEQAIITGNTFTDCLFGIGITGRYVTVANNKIFNGVSQGIGVGEIGNGGSVEVTGNIIHLLGGGNYGGIYCNGSASNGLINISGNTIILVGEGKGIRVDRGGDVDINNNSIQGITSIYGIQYSSDAGIDSNASFRGNTIKLLNESATDNLSRGIIATASLGNVLRIQSLGNKVLGMTSGNSNYAYDYRAATGSVGVVTVSDFNDDATSGYANLEDLNFDTTLLDVKITHNNWEFWGTGTPEGSLAAKVGSIFHRKDGGTGTSFYVKESGIGNTGWAGK